MATPQYLLANALPFARLRREKERQALRAAARARAEAAAANTQDARPKSIEEAEALVNDPQYQESKAVWRTRDEAKNARMADALSLTGTQRSEFQSLLRDVHGAREAQMDLLRRNRGSSPAEMRLAIARQRATLGQTGLGKVAVRLQAILGPKAYAEYRVLSEAED